MRFFAWILVKQLCEYHHTYAVDANPPFNQLDQAACMELARCCKCVLYKNREGLGVLANAHNTRSHRYVQHEVGEFVYHQGGVFRFGYTHALGVA